MRGGSTSITYVVPCLLLTFMLGPIGLALYLGVRAPLRQVYSPAPA